MAKSEQILKKIEIKQLKGLKNVDIDLSDKPLIAIMGANGVGKSTILHALACVNNPVTNPSQTVNHKLCEFFTPTTLSTWQGSSFSVFQEFRDEAIQTQNHKTHFRKVKGRWSPRYSTRIERYISYIGIRTCVPKIELETQQGRIQFNTTHLTDNLSNQVKTLAGYVMNRNYDEYNEHKTGGTKQYIGVSTTGMNYSSLSMGAGEQRIFYILSEVLKAPNYGMILIDEIDLLLHQDALFRLLTKLNEKAIEKHLQIIFTTHAQSIMKLDFIAFRHIHQTSNQTLCFNKTTPDALFRLTGKQERPLEIFVEDDLAAVITKKICSENSMAKYVSIKKYGSIENSFTLASAIILQNDNNLENILIVTDGDRYKTDEEKKNRINKVLTGNQTEDDNRREQAFSKITQFVIPDGNAPETYFHNLIKQLDETTLTNDEKEIVGAAKEINNAGNTHNYFDNLIQRFEWERNTGLSKLVDILAKSNEWNNIKLNIQSWLDTKRQLVIEQ
jgi:ABC-type lipoprotein export system ATPase subunit